MKRILRIFPRKTNATPDDSCVIINRVPGFFDEADEIHISITWTWDIPRSDYLSEQWKYVAPVKIGGPATGEAGGEFVPGIYLKKGYVITSRGCPNRCWFCSVWKREGNIKELSIKEGWNILDDNLLACSNEHIKNVFEMLQRQKKPILFTGGLEAARLNLWIAKELKKLKSKQLFFAYDTPNDLEPLIEASQIMRSAGFTTRSHALRCYVLCGYLGDTFEAAEKRMIETINAGFFPMAMLWRGDDGKKELKWSRWQRQWVRPKLIYKKMKIHNICLRA